MVTASAVVDVRTDKPRATDRFFVDTNVWRYITYAKFTLGNAARSQTMAQVYSAYIERCLKAGAVLYYSPLSYSELAAAIERTELDIYNAQRGDDCHLKQFRLGTNERQTVVAEVQAAWGQVSVIGQPLATPTDAKAFTAAVTLFEQNPLDGYDIFFINAMRAADLTAVITDDVDFTHVSGLRVFTANDTSLRQARMFRKLVAR